MTCGACVAGLPGLDRARRPHRRPAPPPGDGRVELPGRGRADAARRRARVEPVGHARSPSAPTGPRSSACACSSRATRRPSTSTGSAARRRSTSAPRRTARVDREAAAAAGVDFAILGPRESCTGDPARRMGNEYVFQALAEQNVATLNEAGVTKIVASCPHCFNTLANEYPDFGGRYEVDPPHRAARDARARGPPAAGARRALTRSPTTTPATWPATTTCSTRRASWSPPSARRSRWRAAASRRSAAAPAARTCGWRSAAGAINEERVREAAATGADTLAVACPFCTVMLDDGVQSAGDAAARRRRRDAAGRGGRRWRLTPRGPTRRPRRRARRARARRAGIRPQRIQPQQRRADDRLARRDHDARRRGRPREPPERSTSTTLGRRQRAEDGRPGRRPDRPRQFESAQRGHREGDHLVGQSADDARRDGVLVARRPARPAPAQPSRAIGSCSQMERSRHLERHRRTRNARPRPLERRPRPPSVCAAHGRGQRGQSDVAPAAPVA